MWKHRGITGGGAEPPSYLGKYYGNLIILGGGRSVWDDYVRLKDKGFTGQIMAVNDIGMYFDQPIEHWVSLHPDHLRAWAQLRMKHSLPMPRLLHTNRHTHDINVCWDLQPYAPFSGLYAAQVGLSLGYNMMVMCGVPQDGKGRFFDPPWMDNTEHADSNQLKAFRHIIEQNQELRGALRSMSGWTRELLGEA